MHDVYRIGHVWMHTNCDKRLKTMFPPMKVQLGFKVWQKQSFDGFFIENTFKEIQNHLNSWIVEFLKTLFCSTHFEHEFYWCPWDTTEPMCSHKALANQETIDRLFVSGKLGLLGGNRFCHWLFFSSQNWLERELAWQRPDRAPDAAEPDFQRIFQYR